MLTYVGAQLILGQFDVMATTYEMLVADTHTCQVRHTLYQLITHASAYVSVCWWPTHTPARYVILCTS